MKKSSKVLTSKEEILDYIGIKSYGLVKFFMANKLPVLIINGRWYAHVDNLDAYMQKITVKQGTINIGDGDNLACIESPSE